MKKWIAWLLVAVMLLSIAGGTIFYMILVQFIF